MEKNKASLDSIKILNRRSFIITAISLILSLIVSIRLFSLQILNFSFYQKKSVENKVSVKATPPIRGDIFDNEKNLVAANTSLYEFVLYKNLNKKSTSKIIIISSLMGTQTHTSNNAPIYRASKAAANNLMRTISNHFLNDNIIVSSYHPGWVRTDMGGANATLSAKESAKELIKSFENLSFKDTGKFFNYDGAIINF